jgi:uncharacterized phage protein gp47/JayE
MPWSTPTLRDVRSMVRDYVRGSLPGADATIPNSVLRVLSDNQGALCHLTLQYVDWLALQLLPDTAETEWLDRHGDIWLVNSDGTTGRKMATPAIGTANFIGNATGVTVPMATRLSYAGGQEFETIEEFIADDTPSPGAIRALDPGAVGNLLPGSVLAIEQTIPGLTGTATVVTLDFGTDEETDDELRARVLQRIRQPPMGGSANDYVSWTLAVPGVTRAWCSPQEMGIGTVTVRFMCDDLRADNGGFPLPQDIDAVNAYLQTVRPVATKDLFVEAPVPYPIDHRITYLDSDDAATRAAITDSLLKMFKQRQAPGATWYRSWSDQAVAEAVGVVAYTMTMTSDTTVMPSPGYMPVLGDVEYV